MYLIHDGNTFIDCLENSKSLHVVATQSAKNGKNANFVSAANCFIEFSYSIMYSCSVSHMFSPVQRWPARFRFRDKRIEPATRTFFNHRSTTDHTPFSLFVIIYFSKANWHRTHTQKFISQYWRWLMEYHYYYYFIEHRVLIDIDVLLLLLLLCPFVLWWIVPRKTLSTTKNNSKKYRPNDCVSASSKVQCVVCIHTSYIPTNTRIVLSAQCATRHQPHDWWSTSRSMHMFGLQCLEQAGRK